MVSVKAWSRDPRLSILGTDTATNRRRRIPQAAMFGIAVVTQACPRMNWMAAQAEESYASRSVRATTGWLQTRPALAFQNEWTGWDTVFTLRVS